jgi:hypothetical protein
MSNIARHTPTVDRFEPGIQVRNPETLEEFWMMVILDDRADTALPPAHLWPEADRHG